MYDWVFGGAENENNSEWKFMWANKLKSVESKPKLLSKISWVEDQY